MNREQIKQCFCRLQRKPKVTQRPWHKEVWGSWTKQVRCSPFFTIQLCHVPGRNCFTIPIHSNHFVSRARVPLKRSRATRSHIPGSWKRRLSDTTTVAPWPRLPESTVADRLQAAHNSRASPKRGILLSSSFSP